MHWIHKLHNQGCSSGISRGALPCSSRGTSLVGPPAAWEARGAFAFFTRQSLGAERRTYIGNPEISCFVESTSVTTKNEVQQLGGNRRNTCWQWGRHCGFSQFLKVTVLLGLDNSYRHTLSKLHGLRYFWSWFFFDWSCNRTRKRQLYHQLHSYSHTIQSLLGIRVYIVKWMQLHDISEIILHFFCPKFSLDLVPFALVRPDSPCSRT